MRNLGKIDTRYLVNIFENIQTDEVIITEERVAHISERHKEDYYLFDKYVEFSIAEPDYIILDSKNTGTIFIIKRIEGENLNVVVRVALSTDKIGLKNSVMTFFRLRDKNLKKILSKNKLLYKKE